MNQKVKIKNFTFVCLEDKVTIQREMKMILPNGDKGGTVYQVIVIPLDLLKKAVKQMDASLEQG